MSRIVQEAKARGWKCREDDTPGLKYPITWYRPDGSIHDRYRRVENLPLSALRDYAKAAP